jgi:hypothetical protein
MRGAEASEDLLSVTLCGPIDSVDSFVKQAPEAKTLKPKHAWHHSSVSKVVRCPPGSEPQIMFISGSTGAVVTGWVLRPFLNPYILKTFNKNTFMTN